MSSDEYFNGFEWVPVTPQRSRRRDLIDALAGQVTPATAVTVFLTGLATLWHQGLGWQLLALIGSAGLADQLSRRGLLGYPATIFLLAFALTSTSSVGWQIGASGSGADADPGTLIATAVIPAGLWLVAASLARASRQLHDARPTTELVWGTMALILLAGLFAMLGVALSDIPWAGLAIAVVSVVAAGDMLVTGGRGLIGAALLGGLICLGAAASLPPAAQASAAGIPAEILTLGALMFGLAVLLAGVTLWETADPGAMGRRLDRVGRWSATMVGRLRTGWRPLH